MNDLFKERRKTLHVAIGSRCNNNCIFCMEERINNDIGNKTLEEFKEFIKNSMTENFTRIVFTHKEPTLSIEKLIPLADYAKKIGYTDIMLITNGRMLSNEYVSEKLIRAGINHFEISLHGSNEKVHEQLTRTPKSFKQAVKGIENVKKLSNSNKINFSINFTITTFNYKNIADFFEFASKYGPDKIIFNFFSTKSFAKKNWKLLLPNYSEVLGEVKKIKGKKFFLIDFPLCIVVNEFRENIGEIEDYHLQSNKNKSEYIRNDWKYIKENTSSCQKCIYCNVCVKPTTEYLLKYGENEFKSILN
jgi:MoaA/NifB/PqqE/SkfB family radical SAM enzyme